MKIYPQIAAWADEIVAIRRDLHMHPELGFEERRTSSLIAAKLREFGIEDVTEGVGEFGVIAVIRGKRPGKGCVGLRADFDALPMQEMSGVPWASTVPGKAHACGHDGHAAMLLAAARYLNETRDFAGTVVCVFQHAEETLRSGARAIIDDGLFERWPIQEMVMSHDFPDLKLGEVGFGRPGPYQAASDYFTFTVHGKGGHGGNPQLTVDPAAAGQHLYTALQTIVSRNVKPIEAAVLSVGAFVAGDIRAGNIVPDECSMRGTIRTFTPQVRQLIEKRVRELCRGFEIAYNVTIDVTYVHGVPSTHNDPELWKTACAVGREIYGEGSVFSSLPMMTGSEDFSYYEEKVPGICLRIGVSDGTVEHSCPLHNPKFEFNDKALAAGASMMAGMACARLAVLSEEAGK